MIDIKNHPVNPAFAEGANITLEQYRAWYAQSIETPEQFWRERATQFLDWMTVPTQIHEGDFSQAGSRWFVDGILNVSANCIDRHLPARADQTAILWEGDDPATHAHITYAMLHDRVSRLANALKARGVKKGDRVCIYMPMIPEAAYAMLACTRIGAIHSVVFGGFSPESLKDRILDADCCAVITADEGVRGGKKIPLKTNTDTALAHCPGVHTTLVVRHTGGEIAWHATRDTWYHESTANASPECPPEPMNAEDPLFILYTSGSTGKPKGYCTPRVATCLPPP